MLHIEQDAGRIAHESFSAAETSIELLNNIERTVDSLSMAQRTFESLGREIYTLAGNVQAISSGSTFDPNGEVVDCFEKAETETAQYVEVLEARKDSTKEDPQLRGDHEDNIVMEFERTIDRVLNCHNALIELRWALLEHDADLDEPSAEGPFDDADVLIQSLNE